MRPRAMMPTPRLLRLRGGDAVTRHAYDGTGVAVIVATHAYVHHRPYCRVTPVMLFDLFVSSMSMSRSAGGNAHSVGIAAKNMA